MAFDFDETYSQAKYTADAVINEEGVDNSSSLEEKRKADAEAGGVQDARFLGYAEVLSVYADRSDVETLAERRARHLGYDPGQQSFTREAGYDAGAGTSAAPQTQYPEPTGWVEVGSARTDADAPADGTPVEEDGDDAGGTTPGDGE